ncbi:MBL fold metallo-hydrolase [Candidatus Micrarchaeota archaeon]|nr:MBL fold metallo-hydrolase [Candidatus Micrarchaeota archaeon]
MKLTFIGACQEVGKSAFLVESDVKIVLDAGMKIREEDSMPDFSKIRADAFILSHAHLDHSGAAPSLYKHHPIPAFATFPTLPLVNLLWEDSEKIAILNKKALPYNRKDVKTLLKHAIPLPYNAQYAFYEDTRFEFFDAGHILGAAQVLIQNKKTLLYTGDFKPEPTRLHAGAKPPKSDVDVLVTESTYGGADHPDRNELEKRFCDQVQDAVDHNQTVLVPAFAIGRAQEILCILQARGVQADFYLDGMAKTVTDIMLDFPSYIKNPNLLRDAVKRTRFMESHTQRQAAVKKPGVIIATAGMLDGGPALSYLKALNHRQNGVVLLTGYQAPGSNGYALLNGQKVRFNGYSDKVNLPVSQFEFSAHASGPELVAYAKAVNPKHVFCVHGDESAAKALVADLKAEGFDASAPTEGKTVTV